MNSDRYNPSALTNKGNTVFANGDYEKAAEFYKEALRNDSSCTEALYNIGELMWQGTLRHCRHLLENSIIWPGCGGIRL